MTIKALHLQRLFWLDYAFFPKLDAHEKINACR